ncbi:MAG: hypothetical protein KC619_00080 [Myxococcales bacterium]|nr:hypothetical protein [Myxococcales bacterium]
MEIVFVRTGTRRDRFHVTRDDGSEASWAFPSYGDALPHDLVHFVCERELGVRDGIFGAIARGADLERINAKANRAGGKDKYAAFGPDLEGVLWSEALATAPWSATDDAIVEALRASCRRMGVELRALSREDLARTREAMAKMAARWRRLAPREAIHATFP